MSRRDELLWPEVQLSLPGMDCEAAVKGKSCARPRNGRNRAAPRGAKSAKQKKEKKL